MTDPAIAHHYADLGDLMMHYVRAGSGPPVVLLHGFTGSARGWAPIVERLSPEFTTLAMDIIGHGQSDSPEATDHYRMRQVVDDLATLLQRAGYERATWLGYSIQGDGGLLFGMALVTFSCGVTVLWIHRHRIPGYVPSAPY